MPHPHQKNLLTSVQMAHFVATGSLRMDAVVPDEMNQQAIEVLKAGILGVLYGILLSEAFVDSEFVQRLVQLRENWREPYAANEKPLPADVICVCACAPNRPNRFGSAGTAAITPITARRSG